MTNEQVDELKLAIKNEIHQEIAERNGKGWKLIPIIAVIVQVILVGFAVPWIQGVNAELKAHSISIADFRAWKDQGPRYTPADAQVTKMQAVQEATSTMSTMIGRLEGRMDSLQNSMSDQSKQIIELRAALTAFSDQHKQINK